MDEVSARRRDLYLTAQHTASSRLRNLALDRSATGVSSVEYIASFKRNLYEEIAKIWKVVYFEVMSPFQCRHWGKPGEFLVSLTDSGTEIWTSDHEIGEVPTGREYKELMFVSGTIKDWDSRES